MDTNSFSILSNNVLPSIEQSEFCLLLPSGILVPIPSDNGIINGNDQILTPSMLECNYDDQINPLNGEVYITSGLSISIDGTNEIFSTYNQDATNPSTIDDDNTVEFVNQEVEHEILPSNITYTCEHCAANFMHLKLLNRHKRTHIFEKPFKCELCHESFNFNVNLKIHRTFHDDRTNEMTRNVCCICNKVFRRFSSLKGHLNVHAVSDYYNCNLCDEIFLGKQFYDCHFEKSHKKFNDKTARERQTQKISSTVKKDRDCNLCNKSFKKPSMLIRHMRIHNGEKPFKCNMCDRQFSQKNSLTTHLLRHTGEKPYACSLCFLRFTQKGNLKMHKEKVHNKYNSNTDEIKYQCNKCSCVFRKIGSLNRHITEVHSANGRRAKLSQVNMMCANKSTSSTDEINFNEIFSQINDLNQIENPPRLNHDDVSSPSTPDFNQCDNIIQLADRIEDGVVIHRPVQQLRDYRGKKMLSCLSCCKRFTRPSDLLRHMRVHTKEKPFECYLCKRRFSIKRTLSLHYKTHESTLRKFSCSICCKNFRDIRTLIDHGMELHQNCNNYLQCFPCKESFSTAEQLQTHSRMHNRRLSATKRKSYDSNIKMQEPIVVNQQNATRKEDDTRKRQYQCDKCFKSFIKLCHLKQHQLAHTGDRPFQCDTCIKTFKSRNALTIHNRRHLNLKPYKCETCEESFVSKPILKRHKLIHSDVRNFVCPYCQKSFKSNNDCRKHIRIHQKDVLPPPLQPGSDLEGQTTNDDHAEEVITAIVQTKSNGTKTCRYCNRYFKKPIDLRRHERIHTGERPFKCDKCEKSFSLASTLKFHKRIHEEVKNMYPCHVCSNKYASKSSLNVHKRIHTGEKPFKCRYCDTTYRTNGHRNVHESNHLKAANQRGVDPKDVKTIRSSKFENIVEMFTLN